MDETRVCSDPLHGPHNHDATCAPTAVTTMLIVLKLLAPFQMASTLPGMAATGQRTYHLVWFGSIWLRACRAKGPLYVKWRGRGGGGGWRQSLEQACWVPTAEVATRQVGLRVPPHALHVRSSQRKLVNAPLSASALTSAFFTRQHSGCQAEGTKACMALQRAIARDSMQSRSRPAMRRPDKTFTRMLRSVGESGRNSSCRHVCALT